MRIFLTTLLASVRSIFQSRAALELENLALRHPIAVLRRSAAKPLKLTPADRLLRAERKTLLQLRVLGLHLFQDGDVWVSVLPEGEEVLIRTLRLSGVAGHCVRLSDL